MARTKKNQPFPPKWFDLNKYKDVAKLAARGWYKNIYIRRVILRYIEDGRTLDSMSARNNDNIDNVIALLRSNPVFDKPSKDWLSAMPSLQDANIIKDLITDQTFHSPAIERLSPETALHLVSSLPKKRQQVFIEKVAENMEHQGEIDKAERQSGTSYNLGIRLPSWMSNPFEEDVFSAASIYISYFLPKKIMIDAFKAYLERISSLLPPQKPFRQNRFLEWADCGLLPYIDLLIWEVENDVNPTNRERALALGNLGEENIRKTTQRNAELVLDDGIEGRILIATLAAYADEDLRFK